MKERVCIHQPVGPGKIFNLLFNNCPNNIPSLVVVFEDGNGADNI